MFSINDTFIVMGVEIADQRRAQEVASPEARPALRCSGFEQQCARQQGSSLSSSGFC